MIRVDRLEVHRCKTRLPIVRVHDCRTSRLPTREIEPRTNENAEPQRVVRVVLLSDAVEMLPIVERRAVNQQRPSPIIERRFEESDVVCRPADDHGKSIDEYSSG